MFGPRWHLQTGVPCPQPVLVRRIGIDDAPGMHDFMFESGIDPAEAERLDALLAALAEPAEPAALAAIAAELVPLVRKLREDYDDLLLLSQTVLEHSTEFENELSERNDRISALIDNMKRYLSGQLFELIMGGGIQATTTSNRRRRLTVFFSDLVGFTELTDTVEAETLSDVLNTYLNRMAQIADAWGGTIDKFIGDAVMIFFGDRDDSDPAEEAQKCVRMALDMQVANASLAEVWRAKGIDRPLRSRIGINTGHCTVGNFGSEKRMDYTIVGSPVNVASRLEGLAEPGGILISGSTYHLVKDAVECTRRGAVQVKGVMHPIETHDVLRLRDAEHSSPFLQTREDGSFDLAPLSYSPETSSRLERAELQSMLEKALRMVKGGGDDQGG